MVLTRHRPATRPTPATLNGNAHVAPQTGGSRAPRALVLAARAVLWTAILLLALRGGVATVSELSGTDSPAALDPSAAGGTFPVEDARSLAARFTYDYLSYGAGGGGERLAPYGRASSGDLGWDGVGELTVHTAVAVSVDVERADRAVVVVAARVDGPRWLHLAVPVAADDAGRLAVAGSPALVSAPPQATVPSGDPGTVDVALSRELTPVLESFFTAYASGRADDIAYYLPVGQTLRGLDGTVELGALLDVRVAEGEAERHAQATVRWRDPETGAGLAQRYDLRLVDDAGRWYVQWLGAGADAGGADDRVRNDARGGTR